MLYDVKDRNEQNTVDDKQMQTITLNRIEINVTNSDNKADKVFSTIIKLRKCEDIWIAGALF